MYQQYDQTNDDDFVFIDPDAEKPKRGRDFGDSPRPVQPPLDNNMLPTLFGFTRADFEANEDGYLTTSQSDKLAKHVKGEADSMWLLLTIFLGVAMFLALVFTLQGLEMGPLLLGAGAIIAPFMFLAYRRQRALTGDSQENRVVAIEGMWDIVGNYSKDEFYLVVGGKRLKISPRAFDFLRSRGSGYLRAYYAEKSKVLLSAEVLPMPEEKLKNDKLKNEDIADGEGQHDRLAVDTEPEGDIVIDRYAQQQTAPQTEKQHPLE
ncbi:hypothetical protein G4Y79_23475 [Phototrophicus methaneseepsis]|uniref:Uncharacterized protein n=1 Tax=Phototrophicus methaneseepsis TaxID=2710758 RepID=A0A7S8E991_9CHLR|nr:hypothetical protein [Phototrophicus methaneseepsis]QPC82613.1 hypothetical protein G4Y79_23475 [Phototrophicus methaneseepsis]